MRSYLGSSVRLVYVSGRNDGDKMKEVLTRDLARKFFVMTSDVISSEKDFLDTCYGIVGSDVFVFLLNEQSIFDVHCLSQLGLAVSFNIPIISVRRIGFAMNMPLPSSYEKTGIVDGTIQHFFHGKTAATSLPCVTTLREALRKCFGEALLYHEARSHQCVQQISKKILLCHLKKAHQVHVGPDQASCAHTVNGVTFSPFPTPPSEADVIVNKSKDDMQFPALSKSSKIFPPSVKDPVNTSISRQSSSKVSAETKDSLSHSLILPEGNSNLRRRVQKSLQRVPDVSSNNKDATDDNEQRGLQEVKYKGLRRVSSLPNIPTNYLVAQEDSKSAPHTYRFPLSPSQTIQSESYDDDDIAVEINISRACTPAVDADTDSVMASFDFS